MGVKLLPFSLGHLFLMQRFECGFANPDPKYLGSIEDLYLGVAICCRSYEGFLEFISEPDEFDNWCKHWGDSIEEYITSQPGELKQNVWEYYTQKAESFKKYIQDGIVVPKYWEASNGGDDNAIESGAHWSQNILVTLMSELNYSFEDAVNMPMSKALSECFKMAENKGILTLMSDTDLEQIEAVEAKQNGS